MTEPRKHETPLAGGASESNEAGGFGATNPTAMLGGAQVDPRLRLARARGDVRDTRMDAWEPTWPEFVHALSIPAAGGKGGAYYVRGACPGARDDAHMAGARDLLLIIDGDTMADPETGGEPDKVARDGEDRPDYVLPCCDPRAVHEVLKAHGLTHVIHTSASHGKRGADWHKWRAVIPSNATPDNFEAAVRAVLDLLWDAGLYVWPVGENNRLSQPWYFPRMVPERAALFWAAHHDGQSFDVATLAPRPVLPAVASAPRTGGHGNVIGQFNAAFLPGDLLEACGYRRITERRYLSPQSTTGQPGVCILPDSGGRHFYVHNGSDPLADAKRAGAVDRPDVGTRPDDLVGVAQYDFPALLHRKFARKREHQLSVARSVLALVLVSRTPEGPGISLRPVREVAGVAVDQVVLDGESIGLTTM